MSANARSIDLVTPSQLESGKRDNASIQQSKALDRIWIYIPKIENLNPMTLGKKIVDHWEEMIMLMGMVVAFINAATNFIFGWISTSMNFATLGCICILGYKSLRDNKTMQVHLNTFKSQLVDQKQANEAAIKSLENAHQAVLDRQEQANKAALVEQAEAQKRANEASIRKQEEASAEMLRKQEEAYTAQMTIQKAKDQEQISALQGIVKDYETRREDWVKAVNEWRADKTQLIVEATTVRTELTRDKEALVRERNELEVLRGTLKTMHATFAEQSQALQKNYAAEQAEYQQRTLALQKDYEARSVQMQEALNSLVANTLTQVEARSTDQEHRRQSLTRLEAENLRLLMQIRQTVKMDTLDQPDDSPEQLAKIRQAYSSPALKNNPAQLLAHIKQILGIYDAPLQSIDSPRLTRSTPDVPVRV